MCGIIGFYNFENNLELTKQGLKIIKNRGLDNQSTVNSSDGCVGHCLHAMHGFVTQPFQDEKSIFLTNCEIYNYERLGEGRNDAEILKNYLKKGITKQKLSKIDGVYALAKITSKKIVLARDLLGVKPLWYYFDGEKFGFASEKKVFTNQDLSKEFVRELHPRKILIYDKEKKRVRTKTRKFFTLNKTFYENEKKILDKIDTLLDKAINKRLKDDKKIGLLFSGGVDSTYIAKRLKDKNIDFKCYVAGLKEDHLKDSEDIKWAKKVAKQLDLDLEVIEVGLDIVEKELQTLVPLIEDNNVVKVGVALPFHYCTKKAREDGVKLLFSGLGSEEIFAGYQRHKQTREVNKECLSGLKKMFERDLYRDDVITMNQSIELRLPFLDHKLIEYAVNIHPKHKLNTYTKAIFRKHAENIGVPKSVAWRKKKAAQYGSNFDKALDKLSNKQKKYKSTYLKQFYDEGNTRLASLISTGKDSLLATHIMMEQNYAIQCFITIDSENKDSYMYHGPNTHLAKLQAQKSNKPLITVRTKGVKEEELKELKKAIKQAKKQYNIEGIITGALYSDYQRKRIEKICEEIGIKCYHPLWHMNQEEELKLLEKKGFEWIMVKIAAYGLNKEWLGKKIRTKHIQKLKKLHEKYQINIAGEGGEYESLVLNAPFFESPIKIKKSKIIEESKNEATLIIEKAF